MVGMIRAVLAKHGKYLKGDRPTALVRKTLEEVISDYVDEAMKKHEIEELKFADWKRIYAAVEMAHTEHIEILIPQRVVSGTFVLTDTARETLDEIKEKARAKGGSFSWSYYTENNLQTLLGGDKGVKRIIITDGAYQEPIRRMLINNPGDFENVRLYNMELPSGYKHASYVEQSVCQARALTIAILMRIYKEGDETTKMLLSEMLKERLGSKVSVDNFIANIPEKDIEKTDPEARAKRLGMFLDWTVSLVENLGKQLRLLEKFVWCMA